MVRTDGRQQREESGGELMHECPICGELCDCDGEDIYDCHHNCDELEEFDDDDDDFDPEC